ASAIDLETIGSLNSENTASSSSKCRNSQLKLQCK
ncbi:unnamed protein product, partial [Allacma fusca]